MSILDDLLDKWEENHERGIEISPEQLCLDHPELIAEVRWQIQALKAVESGFAFVDKTRVVSAPPGCNGEFHPADDLRISSRFQIVDFHAAGGLGKVYVAWDTVLGRKVAIKFPKKSGMSVEQAARFAQEARITGQLEHPGIVPIHSLCSETGSDPYYVMRFVDGPTLQSKIEDLHKSAEVECSSMSYEGSEFRYLLQSFVTLCNIVAFAHQHLVIHRDIKPSNVMLGPFGETLLLDWGIAKSLATQVSAEVVEKAMNEQWMTGITPVHTKPGRPIGTPAYASPEQLAGDLEHTRETSDIYSLGATLFCILSGKAPVDCVGLNRYMTLVQNPETDLAQLLPAKVPKKLRAICKAALAVSPKNRYPTALELSKDIDRYLAREPISVLQDRWWERALRTSRRHPVISTAIVATAFLLTAASIVTSYLLSNKNAELAGVVDALDDANSITMRSLRTMVDEVVFIRFAEGGAISPQERLYIDSIQRNYSDLATVGGNEKSADNIRGEAELQLGRIHLLLGEDQSAIEHLKTAIRKLTRSFETLPTASTLNRLLSAYETLASLFEMRGTVEQSLETVNQVFVFLEPIKSRLPSVVSEIDPLIHGKLRRLKANALVQKYEWKEAIDEFQQAKRLLETSTAQEESQDQLRIVALCECYSGLARLLQEHGTTYREERECLELADKAVKQLEQLHEGDRERPRIQLAFARVLYNRSRIRESRNDLSGAIQDIRYSHSIVSTLYKRYGSVEVYREYLSVVLERWALLARQSGDELDGYLAAREMTEFPTMSNHEIAFARDMMEWRLSVDEEKKNARDLDTYTHLVSVTRLQSALHRDQGDSGAALATAERSIELAQAIAEMEPSRQQWIVLQVACWLDKLEAELMDGQNTDNRRTLRHTQGLYDQLEAGGTKDVALEQRLGKLRERVSSRKVRADRPTE